MREIYIGLMSGTSVDSIDSVMVDLGNQNIQILEKKFFKIPKTLKQQVLEAVNSDDLSTRTKLNLDNQFGILFAKSALNLLENKSIKKSNILAIGSHGQTIKHSPTLPNPFSMQVGNPKIIYKKTGIRTIADFRSADIEAGGEGAPLTPLFHQHLFKCNNLEKGIVINIGGISNLSFINNKKKELTGFDCGPGNCLMDAWMRYINRGNYDDRGGFAATGKSNPGLLKLLLDDPFFVTNQPKSTGPDYFSLAWLQEKISKLKIVPSKQDVQATLSELTAQTIFLEIEKLNAHKFKIYLCGGGINNNILVFSS